MMFVPSVAELADQLYAAPPEDFVAARNRYAAQARQDGDRALAAAIVALRRPTVGAWLVNLLALHRADLIDRWLAVGAAIGEAQAALDGQELRRLAGDRRDLLDELLAAVRGMAGEAGHPAGRHPLPEAVTQTLNAALSDPEVGHQVREGRLLATVTYAGFGASLGELASGGSAGEARSRPAHRARPSGKASPDQKAAPDQKASSDHKPAPPTRPARPHQPITAGRTGAPAPAATADGLAASADAVRARQDELRLRRAQHGLAAARAVWEKTARNLEAVTAQLADVQRRVDRARRSYDEAAGAVARAEESVVEAGGSPR
jgi:hypothetical protein